MGVVIRIFTDHIEVLIKDTAIAFHRRSFARCGKVEHPSHRQQLLTTTPNFKYQRIRALIGRMGEEIARFLDHVCNEGDDPVVIAYGLFKLLKTSSKEMLLSAVREANNLKTYKLRYIESLLTPRGVKEESPVYPRDASLLTISYRTRELTEYDEPD